MLNYVVLYTSTYLLQNVMPKSFRSSTDSTQTISAHASLRMGWLQNIFGGSRINAGLFLAVIAIIIFWIMMKKTTLGFEIRSVGMNPFASEYAGMSSKKTIILSMVISGVLSGLGGVVEGLGTYQNFFTQTSSLSIGFDGMSVALLGGGSALGILLASLLFSILKIGGLGMQTGAGVPFEIVNIVIAAIIFFVAIDYVIGLLFKQKKATGTNAGAKPEQVIHQPKGGSEI